MINIQYFPDMFKGSYPPVSLPFLDIPMDPMFDRKEPLSWEVGPN